MSNKKLIVLDIDNTLIYADYSNIKGRDYGVYNIDKDIYKIYKRNYVEEFLEYCFFTFKVGIWSSAFIQHIDNVIDYLKIDKNKLEFIYDRSRCTQRNFPDEVFPLVLKRFHKLKNKGYKLEEIIGIDDNKDAYRLNYGNLIPVSRWAGYNLQPNKKEDELLQLIKYLETIKDVPDIRKIWKQNWYQEITNKI